MRVDQAAFLQSGESNIGCKVSHVLGDGDEAEKPPCSGHHSARPVLRNHTPSLWCERGQAEPQTLLQGKVSFLVLKPLLGVLVAVGREPVYAPEQQRGNKEGPEDAAPHRFVHHLKELKQIVLSLSNTVYQKCHKEPAKGRAGVATP